MNNSKTADIPVAIGATFACDGLDQPLQKARELTGINVRPSWIPYGTLLSTLEAIDKKQRKQEATRSTTKSAATAPLFIDTPEFEEDNAEIDLEQRGFSESINIFLIRLEDMVSSHPEMTMDFEGRAAEAKKRIKEEKKRRIQEIQKKNKERKRGIRQQKSERPDDSWDQPQPQMKDNPFSQTDDEQPNSAASEQKSSNNVENFEAALKNAGTQLLSCLQSFCNSSRSQVLLVFCPPSGEVMTSESCRCAYFEVERYVLDNIQQHKGSICAFAPWSLGEAMCKQVHVESIGSHLSYSKMVNLHAVPSRFLTDGYILPEAKWTKYYNALTALAAHCPYSVPFYSYITLTTFRYLHLLLSVRKKVVIVDCDNTLWGGNIGEARSNELDFAGKYWTLQSFLVTLKANGSLICLSSKNTEQDVRHVFLSQRHHMKLTLDDIVLMKVDWRSKADNIQEVAETLKLGLESFVFMDDNPIEIAEVEAKCPGVSCLHLLQEWNEEQLTDYLHRCWVFDGMLKSEDKQTEEDQRRTELYKAEEQRQELLTSSSNFSAFLSSLNVNIELKEDSKEDIRRISQLSSKTNQMNVGKIVFTENELHTMLDKGTHRIVTATVTDRFGHYGLVGLIIFRNQIDHMSSDWLAVSEYSSSETDTESIPILGVTAFLMSCRTLHRGVEQALMRKLGREAEKKGAKYVRLNWSPSDRNEPARLFLWNIPSILHKESKNLIDHEADICWDINALKQSFGGGDPHYVSEKPAQRYVFVPKEVAKSCYMCRENVEDMLINAKISTEKKSQIQVNRDSNSSKSSSSSNAMTDATTHTLAYCGSSGIVLKSDVYQYIAASEEIISHLTPALPTSLEDLSHEGEYTPDTLRMQNLWAELLSHELEEQDVTTRTLEDLQIIGIYEQQCKFRRKMRQQAKLAQYSILREEQGTTDGL